jgi:hypothetical protein
MEPGSGTTTSFSTSGWTGGDHAVTGLGLSGGSALT